MAWCYLLVLKNKGMRRSFRYLPCTQMVDFPAWVFCVFEESKM